MNRRSILFVDHASALGGAEQSLLLLLKHLDKTQWQPHLVCAGGPLAEAAITLNVPVHSVSLPRLRRSPTFLLDWFDTARTIGRITQSIDAVLLHSNTVRASIYTALAAHLAQRPFVWHMRDFWLSESEPRLLWADKLGKRLLCASASAVIANSCSVAAHLPCSKRVTVVHNGIEQEQFDPSLDGTPFRQRHDIPLGVPVAGMVGRLRPWKGQETFLRAAALVHQARSEARFLIVGGDPFQIGDEYSHQLHRLAAELGLDGHVTFTGHLDDVRPALAAMDVFVHPGAAEPFGLVNLEAMAMSRPVVGFAHGALPEIVVDGETGLLVPPANIQGLAQAMEALLDDPERARTMGAAGRIRAKTSFDVRHTANLVGRLYEDLT
ncbi:MAG TPA: glycosyltransferase family 4 protein [Anaerolineae bacterium]